MRQATRAISTILCCYVFLYLVGGFDYLGISIHRFAHRAIVLAMVLVLTFLFVPAVKGKSRERLPWYDIVFIVTSLAMPLYIFIYWEKILVLHTGSLSLFEWTAGILLIISLLEATRRTFGWAITVICGLFICYNLSAGHFPGFLHARNHSLENVVAHLSLFTEGIFGIALDIASTTIITFITFGALLQSSGAGEFFTDLAVIIAGRYRGGPAKVSCVSSGLFGMMSGSAVANVMIDGVVTIPLMIKTGYKPHFAGAVEAAASNGGQIMPPVMGTAAFLLSEFLQIPYYQVCFASAIPAALYYIAMFLTVDFEAGKTGIRGVPQAMMPSFKKVLAVGWVFLFPIVVMITLLMVLHHTPEKAGLIACVIVVIVSWFRKDTRMGTRKILIALEDAGRTMASIGTICAAAGIIVGVIGITGLGVKLSQGVIIAAGGNIIFILVLAAAACVVLGMGLPTPVIYILLSALVGPALVRSGILPLAAIYSYYIGEYLRWLLLPYALLPMLRQESPVATCG